jgi:thiamine-monophosphate kinase
MTVGQAGEHRVIDLVRSRLSVPPAFVVHGIGDDAAVLEPPRNELEVLTTDALVEGVHFDRRFVEPSAIGYRALAVNLSDLAAMGAGPRAALLSLALPPDLPWDDLVALVDGLIEGAARYRVALVGGNVTRSPGPLMVDVTLTGSAKRRKVLTRGGGRAGDALFVTGRLGAAAAGLAWLQAHGAALTAVPAAVEPGVARYLRPEPRLRFGVIVGRSRAASACIDLSDGLADAVRQMAEACGTGAAIDETKVPVAEAAAAQFAGEPDGPLRAALSGGEDYELLCAVPKRARRRFEAAARLSRLPVTEVGELTPERALVLRRGDRVEPLPAGFEHFVGSADSS